MKRQIGILRLLAVMTLVLLTGVSAATTVGSPTSNSAVSGSTQFLNISETGTDVVVNVTWEYKVSGGSWTWIADIVNDTAEDADFNTTWDSTSVTDQGGIQINISAYTTTTGGATFVIFDSLLLTGIDIDNTNPTSSYGSATPSDKTTSENTTLVVVTASDASVVNGTLTLSPGYNQTSGNSYFSAVSGNVLTWYLYGLPDSTFSYSFTTVDGLDTSTSATRYITIDTSRARFVEDEVTPAEEGIPEAKKDFGGIFIIMAIVVIVGYLWNKSKK